jgi:hypothetical protein
MINYQNKTNSPNDTWLGSKSRLHERLIIKTVLYVKAYGIRLGLRNRKINSIYY